MCVFLGCGLIPGKSQGIDLHRQQEGGSDDAETLRRIDVWGAGIVAEFALIGGAAEGRVVF